MSKVDTNEKPATNAPTKDSGDDKKEKLNQVFQGKFMRENASFFDKLFYRYPWPLLESSMQQ